MSVFSLLLAAAAIALPVDPPHDSHHRGYVGVPAFAQSKGGRLWAGFIASPSCGEDGRNYIVYQTSGDGGKTWREWFRVSPDSPGRRASDPRLWIDPEGRLWMFVITQNLPGHTDEVESFAIIDNPDEVPAEFPTFTDYWHHGVLGRQPIVLRDGTYLFPVSDWSKDPSACFLASRDRGRTFERLGGVGIPKKIREYDQHNVIQLADGTLRAFVRTRDDIWTADSRDGGRTWDKARPTRLGHRNSTFFVRTLRSGRVLLIKHGRIGEKLQPRTNLTAYLSEDGGTSWKGGLVLETRSSSEPDGMECADGVIRIVRDLERTGARQILLDAFTEEDVLAGKGVSKAFRLGQVISTNTGRGHVPGRLLAPEGAYAADNRTEKGGEVRVMTPSGRLWRTAMAVPANRSGDAFTYSYLSTSTDGGRTWREILVSDPDDRFARRAENPSLAFAADGSLVWSWTDGGEEWSVGLPAETDDVPDPIPEVPALPENEMQYGNRFVHEENFPKTYYSGGETLYREHAVDGRLMTGAKAAVTLWEQKSGSLAVSFSTDGTNWISGPVLKTGKGSLRRFDMPKELFPCANLKVLFRASPNCRFRLANYRLVATVDGAPRNVLPPVSAPDGKDWFRREDYGAVVPGDSAALRLWTADSAWKVPRRRAAPTARTQSVRVATAANEAEIAQLVLLPKESLADARVEAHVEGIPCDVLRVGYVPVRVPTDSYGRRDDYPDPLFPQDGAAFPVAAGRNQPFWIRVKPPKGAPKGIRRGELTVKTVAARDRTTHEVRVPFEVEVFGFGFPDRVTCRSAFGCSAKTDYRGLFASAHISPYDPAPGVQWTVRWNGDEPEFDFAAWDAAMDEAFARYGFNTFRMRIDGLGSGNFVSHGVAEIGGVRAGDPRYERRMAAYLGGIERHLRERGWLDRAYVYFFDEPDEKDYAHIMKGFATLKRHAPGLRAIITEEPCRGLLGGPDIWCAHTEKLHAHPDVERQARARGDEIWWYLCWKPKAPFATLFVDHPGIALRTWLWQTWSEGVSGVLVWQTTHWNSYYVYGPDARQDPFVDTMCRHSYGMCWGNGDGRLVYPDGKGGLLSSVRFEMLREGLEDYEYFALLRRQAPDSPLLSVPAEVSESPRSYAVDPSALGRHRLRLARELERIHGKGRGE